MIGLDWGFNCRADASLDLFYYFSVYFFWCVFCAVLPCRLFRRPAGFCRFFSIFLGLRAAPEVRKCAKNASPSDSQLARNLGLFCYCGAILIFEIFYTGVSFLEFPAPLLQVFLAGGGAEGGWILKFLQKLPAALKFFSWLELEFGSKMNLV